MQTEEQQQEQQPQQQQEQQLQQQQEQQPQQQRDPRCCPLTAGERARAERDLRMGAHPIQGERENDAFKV